MSTNTIVFIIIITAIITFILIRQFPTYWYSLTCKKWPKTKGKIVTTPRSKNDDDDDESPRTKGGFRSGYGLSLTYEYTIDGKTYEGDTVSFNMAVTKNPILAEKLGSVYDPGQEIDVYYNPKKHSISVLKP